MIPVSFYSYLTINLSHLRSFKFMARSGKQWGANLYVQKSRGSEGGAVLSRWDTLCSTLKLKKVIS